MDDVQNLEQGLPNTNSSQIKQGRGKSNKNQQTRHFYGKWHRTSVSQNFSQESRFSNVISMWSAKTYHVWGLSLALASPWWFCALCCQIKKVCTGERVFHVFGRGKMWHGSCAAYLFDRSRKSNPGLWIDSLANDIKHACLEGNHHCVPRCAWVPIGWSSPIPISRLLPSSPHPHRGRLLGDEWNVEKPIKIQEKSHSNKKT